MVVKKTGSASLSLNKEDLRKVSIGSLIALSGALITILTEVIAKVDFGAWTPVVAAVSAVVVNLLRIWVSNNQ